MMLYFFNFKNNLFTYLFVLCWIFAAVLRCSLIPVLGLLIVVASLLVENRF